MIPDWSGTFYVDQAGLQFVDTLLPLPSEYWDYDVIHHVSFWI